jgi:hypothetical protein
MAAARTAAWEAHAACVAPHALVADGPPGAPASGSYALEAVDALALACAEEYPLATRTGGSGAHGVCAP